MSFDAPYDLYTRHEVEVARWRITLKYAVDALEKANQIIEDRLGEGHEDIQRALYAVQAFLQNESK